MRQVGAALGAELVGVRDFAAALGARRMQVVLAVGTEIEARGDGRGALRAREGQRLANQQIDYEAKDAVGWREDEDKQGPKHGVHAAALGVFVNVAEHQEEGSNENGSASDDAGQGDAGGHLMAEPFRFGRKIVLIALHVVDVDGNADGQRDQPEGYARPDQPAWNDAEFVAESGAFASPAEADQTHAFVK